MENVCWSDRERKVLMGIDEMYLKTTSDIGLGLNKSALADIEPGIRLQYRRGFLEKAPTWYLAMRSYAEMYFSDFHFTTSIFRLEHTRSGQLCPDRVSEALHFYTSETTPVLQSLGLVDARGAVITGSEVHSAMTVSVSGKRPNAVPLGGGSPKRTEYM